MSFFSAVRDRWSDALPVMDSRFIESSRGYMEIQDKLLKDENWSDLSYEIYPELYKPSSDRSLKNRTPEARRAELLEVAQMLQVMENTWLGLDQMRHPERTISQGWWSIFRRWSGTRSFHRNWPILRAEFSTGFATFCETKLGLIATKPEIVPWFGLSEAERLAVVEEFDREWPKERESNLHGTLTMSLQEMIDKARISECESLSTATVWAIVQKPRPEVRSDASASDCRGIILVFEGSSHYPAPTKNQTPRDFELVAWIRRSHRGIGLGTFGLDKKDFDKDGDILEKILPKGSILSVRHPVSDDVMAKARWKQFFSMYGFVAKDQASPGNEVVTLIRQF